jgi:cytochrome c5
MMKTFMLSSFSFLFLVVMPALSQTGTVKEPSSSVRRQPDKTVHVAQQRDGQKVFDQNCSRCHNTPQGFSPRITGTVVRHMRVRAELSKEDADAVLRFLNP